MAEHMDHDDVMELAVQLACSFLGTSQSGSTDAEDLIFNYYRQIRNVEVRISNEYMNSSKEKKAKKAKTAGA
jgi:hypothetical protein